MGGYRENRALPFYFVFDFQGKNISSPYGMSEVKRKRKKPIMNFGKGRWSRKNI